MKKVVLPLPQREGKNSLNQSNNSNNGKEALGFSFRKISMNMIKEVEKEENGKSSCHATLP